MLAASGAACKAEPLVAGKRPDGGRDRSGWVDGKPPTQPNLRLLPAFPCETAPMTPVPGADATTRGLPSPMSAGHAMGRPPRNQSVLLTCSKYVPMQQKLA